MDSVTIYITSKKIKGLYFTSDFFEHTVSVVIKIFKDRLEVTRPSIDYQGVSYKPQKNKNNSYVIQMVSEELPLGAFKIDNEEINIDKLVIYFSDRIR
jgi:hypothetical protein